MNIKEKMEKFNKRWNIISEKTYEDNLKDFKIRILNIFNDVDDHVTKESIALFCQYYAVDACSTRIIERLSSEQDEKELYRILELIFSLDIEPEMGFHAYEVLYSKNILLKRLIAAINLSNINLAISVSNKDEVIFYPKGEKLLDKEVVNNVLSFLDGKSNEHFIQSLNFYQENKAIKSAESLRRSLEEFLRTKLQNSKGLDANIKELGKKLKDAKSDSQIKNIILQTFAYLDQYFNENSKHNDGDINSSENEFLIYQGGLLMRYINKII